MTMSDSSFNYASGEGAVIPGYRNVDDLQIDRLPRPPSPPSDPTVTDYISSPRLSPLPRTESPWSGHTKTTSDHYQTYPPLARDAIPKIKILPNPPGGSGPGVTTHIPTAKTSKGNSKFVKRWLIAAVVVLLLIIVILASVFGTRASINNGMSGGTGSGGTSSGDGNGGTGNGNGDGTVDQGSPTSFFNPTAPTDAGGSSGGDGATRTAGSGSATPTVQSSSPTTAYLFGRGQDSHIWYRQTDGDKWISNWEMLDGSQMRSQPSAASLEDGQMQVFAYAKNFTIQSRTFTEGKWSDEWTVLGLAARGPPYAKVCGKFGLNVVIQGTDTVVNRNWYTASDGTWYYRGASAWEQHDPGASWCSDPVVGSAGEMFRLAVLGYDGPRQSLVTKTWLGTWGRWTSIGGDFRGNIAMVSRNSEEFLTFGIMAGNLSMAYHNWTRIRDSAEDPNTQIVGLGDQAFQSVPVPIVMGTSRLDVLAIGTDDRLKHRALIGQTWSPKGWQDLGGAFNSTPAVVWLAKDKISVYGLGVNGNVFHGSWRVDTDKYEWGGDGDWISDKMTMSLEGFNG